MFKSAKKFLLLTGAVFLFSFIFFSCQKEFSNESGGTVPVITSRTSVEGRVTDEGGMPVFGAMVKAGINSTQTDKNGMFKIDGAVFTTAETFVTVNKSGYFKGSRTFFSRDNSNNFLKVQLLRKTISDRIPASAGGDVEVKGNGGNVHFEPNSFVTSTGADYHGTVMVATQYLDPSGSQIGDQMPGDLRGTSTTGAVVGLTSFGMVGVELMDEGGQPLQIKAGKTATLNVNIPQDRVAAAPSTIPLWFFNDSTGLWKQEGSAIKNGDIYSGEVSHFTFWNCDDPYEYVKIHAHIVNNAGLSVSAAKVQITDANGSSAYDYTDGNGYVDGFVPKNRALTIEVLNSCGQSAYLGNIGPFNTETNLGNITLAQSTTSIQGTAVSCTGGPVTDGYVQMLINGTTEFASVINGSFSLTFINCQGNTTAQLIAVDNATLKQGNPVTVNITSSNINAGQLTACGVSSATFFNLTIGGVNLTANTSEFLRQGWKDTWDSTSNESDYAYAAYDSLLGKYMFVGFTYPTNHIFTVPYSVPASSGLFMGYVGMANSTEMFDLEPVDPASSLNFTEYGNLGQFIAGNFNGMVVRSRYDSLSNNNQATDTVNAVFNFRVRHVTNPF